MTRRLNEDITSSFDELGTILTQHGQHFRARAYREASDIIRSMDADIFLSSQLCDVKGLGKTMLQKIDELQTNGTLKILEKERSSPMTQLTKVFGIGPKKAAELISSGVDSFEKLQMMPKEKLPSNIVKGIMYFDDIQERIPRNEIDEYQCKLTDTFNKVAGNAAGTSSFKIVGSYRRGALCSGDIDVIVTSTHPEVFHSFLDLLIKERLVVDVLTRGKTKSMCVSKLPGERHRRIDLLYTSPEEYAFAVLYFTGSKIFNTIQRHQASHMGYTLNEHGLFDAKTKEKVPGVFIREKDIFSFLNMKYIKPYKRTDHTNIKYV